jgi:hypothetical protein
MSTYPTTSLHSFSDVLQQRLTSPFSICLGVGVGAASYHAFANVSSYFFGPVAAINEEKLGLKKDVGQAVQLWEWFYETATVSKRLCRRFVSRPLNQQTLSFTQPHLH